MKFLALIIVILNFLSSEAFSNNLNRIDSYPSRHEKVSRSYMPFEKYTFVKVQVLDANTNKVKRISFNYIPNSQSADIDCLKPIYDSLALGKEERGLFAKFVAFNEKFYKTKYGVLVDKACIKKTSKRYMEENILSSYQRGIKCLEKMGTTSSRDLLSKLGKIFKDKENPPKIFCHEDDMAVSLKGIKWDSAKAYASPDSSFDTDSMKHPFVSFNPNGSWTRDAYSFQGTLFHELFHNTGHIHTETIEKPYSCQSCCFNSTDNPNLMMSVTDNAMKAKEMACKVCAQDYEGITDKRYIEDFTQYRILDGRFERIFPVLKVYMKEGPRDDFALKQLLKADAASTNKLAPSLTSLLKGKQLTSEADESKFAQTILHFSRGNFKESAEFIKQIDSWSSLLSNHTYKKIYDDISKDLFFISLTDSSFSMKQTNDPFLNNMFKKTATSFSFNN